MTALLPGPDDPAVAPPPAGGGPRRLLLPRGVRLGHFIVLPTVAMGLFVFLSRIADRFVLPALGPAGTEVYQVLRTVTISALMAGIIGWLALRHRHEYETRLEARNQALEETRDFLSRVIEGSGEAIITVDAGNCVTSWNRAAEAIYGWSAAEMTGHGVARLLPPGAGQEEELAETDAALRAGRTVRHHDARRVRKDGRLITVHVTRSPMYDAEGRYAGCTAIVDDVTDLKEMESRLREQETLAAVGQLAASVAHEIKNPLAGIRGACEIISDGYGPDDPRKELSVEVLRQVDRLNRTVQELLVYARPKNKKPVPTDLNAVLDRVVRLLREDAQTRGIELERRLQPGLPSINVDPQQMEQVFFNLILNAFQAMDYRGRVLVATEANGEEIHVRVRDDGPGIAPDAVQHIFDAFFTTRSKGTGLGLAIVRNIVQNHDGTITVDSRPGEGAEFVIALPMEPDAP